VTGARRRERTDERLEGLVGRLQARDIEFARCTFDSCSARGGAARGLQLVGCTAWACSLHDVVLEDCVIEDLKTSYGRGGRTMPLVVWGGAMCRVTIRGTVGGLIWNPPREDGRGAVAAARAFYEGADWALDVRDARFRSVPALRFGPPGALIKRDPETQPLIEKNQAREALDRVGSEIGVWRVVLEGLLERGWPDDVVLMPALGGSKARYQEELAGIARLRSLGALS
jgi:hypothetical protein